MEKEILLSMDVKALLTPFVGPLGEAALSFPAVALLLALPFGAWHYRRHGKLHPWRAFLGYSFVFYAIAAVFLVSFHCPTGGPIKRPGRPSMGGFAIPSSIPWALSST